MILLDSKIETTASSPLSLSPSEEEPTLSFSQLLKGIDSKTDDASPLTKDGPLILALQEDKTAPLSKEKLLELLKGKEASLRTTKDVTQTLPVELNPELTANMSSKELKVLVTDAKKYLKNKILQSDGYKQAEIKDLPKTLKGLVQVAQKIGIDISKVSVAEVRAKVAIPRTPTVSKSPANTNFIKLESATSQKESPKPLATILQTKNADVKAKVETKAVPKVDIKPETKVALKQELPTQFKKEIKPETKVDIKQEVAPQVNKEIKPETKVELKQELPTQFKKEIKPETKVDIKQEIAPQVNKEIKPETKVELKQEVAPQVNKEIKAETKVDIKQEVAPQVNKEIKATPKVELKQELAQIHKAIKQEVKVPKEQKEDRKELLTPKQETVVTKAKLEAMPLFKAQLSKEITTEQLVSAKVNTTDAKMPKTKADETLKMLLRGEKVAKGDLGLTADFSVATAKVLAPSATTDARKNLESLLHGEESESPNTHKVDGVNVSKSDSLDVKMSEAKQMTKYLSGDVKTAIEDYKAPFTRVKVQLNPEKLGSVELTVVQRGKNLHINLSSNNAAINTLALNSNDLKTQLTNNGINNATLNFNNNSQGSESSFSQQQHQNSQQREEAKREYNYFENEEVNEEIVNFLEIVVPNYA